MTQKQQLLEMFETNGNMLKLGQILQTNLAAEYRARISDLRREGYDITCTISPTPSENIYMLINPNQAKIDEYTELRNTYPENSPHRYKIDTQIAKLKG